MVSGDIILMRGASGHSVFQISVSVAPGRSPITRIPRGAKFLAQRVREAKSGVLGSVVGGRSGKDPRGSDRQVVDDRSAALHHCQCGLRHEKRAVEIGGKDILPHWVRQFVDCQIRVRNAGIVDEDIDFAELSASGTEEIVDGMRIADITRIGEDLRFPLRQFLADFLQGGFVAASQDEIATLGCKGLREGMADAAGRAGDEGDLAL